jgi:hypothetical protein
MQSYRILDVVYMVIEEVKTVLDKNTMGEAINNIASVKQLIFIQVCGKCAVKSSYRTGFNLHFYTYLVTILYETHYV